MDSGLTRLNDPRRPSVNCRAARSQDSHANSGSAQRGRPASGDKCGEEARGGEAGRQVEDRGHITSIICRPRSLKSYPLYPPRCILSHADFSIFSTKTEKKGDFRMDAVWSSNSSRSFAHSPASTTSRSCAAGTVAGLCKGCLGGPRRICCSAAL